MFQIDPEISGLFQGLSGWEYEELKRDIAENGVRVPIEVTDAGTVVDGHQRLRAWLELGKDLSELPVRWRTYASKTEIRYAAIRLNLLRRHLNSAQRAKLAIQHFLPSEKSKAKERQATSTGGSKPQLTEKFQGDKGEAYDLAAKRVGLSGRTLRMAEKVFTEASRRLVDSVLNGKTSINKAFNKVKKLEEFQERASESLKSAHLKGELSFDKATQITELPMEYQPSATEKVVKEQLTTRETELLVNSLLEQPKRMEEILSKPIVELTPPPKALRSSRRSTVPASPNSRRAGVRSAAPRTSSTGPSTG